MQPAHWMQLAYNCSNASKSIVEAMQWRGGKYSFDTKKYAHAGWRYGRVGLNSAVSAMAQGEAARCLVEVISLWWGRAGPDWCPRRAGQCASPWVLGGGLGALPKQWVRGVASPGPTVDYHSENTCREGHLPSPQVGGVSFEWGGVNGTSLLLPRARAHVVPSLSAINAV